ncbi:MAG: hypothetical protein HOH74_17295 [Gemmatimonadetes bacterium]|jgi:hypothetical protein|nr:hypothetical protein [Gemmatimonadota bacterium]
MNEKCFSISLPEYDLETELDYNALGEKVDPFLCSCFGDGRYVLRSIASSDHADKTMDELVGVILALGTDKYDPARMEVAHKSFRGYNHDFHGTGFEVLGGAIERDADWEYDSLFADTSYHFCEHAPYDRGYPCRIDVLMVYDGEQVERARHIEPEAPLQRQGVEHYLFRFRYAGNKQSALSGVVCIA